MVKLLVLLCGSNLNLTPQFELEVQSSCSLLFTPAVHPAMGHVTQCLDMSISTIFFDSANQQDVRHV